MKKSQAGMFDKNLPNQMIPSGMFMAGMSEGILEDNMSDESSSGEDDKDSGFKYRKDSKCKKGHRTTEKTRDYEAQALGSDYSDDDGNMESGQCGSVPFSIANQNLFISK